MRVQGGGERDLPLSSDEGVGIIDERYGLKV